MKQPVSKLPRAEPIRRRCPKARQGGGVLVLGWLVLQFFAGCSPASESDDAAAGVFPADWESELVEVRGCRQSIDHDLEFVRLLVSEDARERYETCVTDAACTEPFEVGSLFLKPQYNDEQCAELVAISVAKREGEADEPGPEGWRWQLVNAEGDVLQDGKPRRCTSCHATCDGSYDMRCAMDP